VTSQLELVEIEAIKKLKARYFRLMDTKQWDEFKCVFTADAVMDVSDDAGPEHGHVQGRDRIAKSIERAVGPAFTAHHGHMPEIELTGVDVATGIWAMFDYVEFSPAPDRKGLKGYGHYHEKYAKVDGSWFIEFMKLKRLRVDPLT
jgi:hypothetical protein